MSDNSTFDKPGLDNNHETKYFDLHVTGIGYLNRVRDVPVKRAQPFLAVDISALHGDSEDVQYTRFDCRVSGSDAKTIIEQLRPVIDGDNNKVLVGFAGSTADAFALMERFNPDSGIFDPVFLAVSLGVAHMLQRIG